MMLAANAVSALLLASVLSLPTYYAVVGGRDARNVASFVFPWVVAAVLALWSPAAAMLVLVRRDRRSRRVGAATAAAMAVSAGVAVPYGMLWAVPKAWLIAAVAVLVINVVVFYELPFPPGCRDAPQLG